MEMYRTLSHTTWECKYDVVLQLFTHQGTKPALARLPEYHMGPELFIR